MQKLIKEFWDNLSDGREVDLYTLTTSDGASVTISTLGGGLIKMMMPDRNGILGDCILGFDKPEPYLDPNNGYLGLLVGRFANRIRNGIFTLDGIKYRLPLNDNGANCLHGNGRLSYNIWKVDEAADDHLTLSFFSPDMEDGFPGNFTCTVTYTLTEDHVLRIAYKAECDQNTYVNLTNHAYFNLACDESTIYDHVMQLNADTFTPIDSINAPTGEIRPVAGTAMDFTEPKPLRDGVLAEMPDVVAIVGIDHNFCLRNKEGDFAQAAIFTEPKSGRKLEVWTDMPGIQIYTSNFMAEETGKYGLKNGNHRGCCFETQRYPDAPNMPQFPSSLLKAGETFETVTEYRFGAEA